MTTISIMLSTEVVDNKSSNELLQH